MDSLTATQLGWVMLVAIVAAGLFCVVGAVRERCRNVSKDLDRVIRTRSANKKGKSS